MKMYTALRLTRLLGGSALFAGLLGCGLADAATGTLSAEVSVTPDSVLVGESVLVRLDATGQSLYSMRLDLGDGQVDSTGVVGSKFGATRTHVYGAAGTRTITATLQDAELGEISATATVTVHDTTSGS